MMQLYLPHMLLPYWNTVLCSMTNQVTQSRIKARPIVTLMAMPFMMPSIPAG
ncbi:hypothetical protein OROHE_009142 [Orobanche hederae]